MKKIRLTESEFHTLIKRMVMEVQEEMDPTHEMEEEFLGGMFGNLKAAAQEVAGFFKNEVLSDMDEDDIDELKDKIEDVNIDRELAKVDRRDNVMMAEGYITEGIGDKLRSFLEGLGIYGGVGTSVTGLLGFIANVTGWSQTEMMSKAHEIVQGMGITGPVSVLVILAGLVMALGSSVSKYNRTHR